MGFKRVISFDHLSVGQISAVAGHSYAGMTITGNSYGQGPPTVIIDTDGRKKASNGGLYSECVFKFNNIGLDISKRVIMGFRHKPERQDVFGFGVTDGISIRSNIIWSCYDIGQTEEAYVEAVFDFLLNKVSMYVNGVMTKTANFPAAEMKEFFTKYGCFTFYGNNYNLSSRVCDVYFRDQTDAEVIEPLGNVQLIPIPCSVTSAGWTSAAGQTLTETLSAIAQAGTPVITSPGTTPVTPLVATLSPVGDDSQVVLAASFISSALDSTAPAKTLTGKLTTSGTDLAGNSLLLTTTMQPGKNIGMFEKAPDGSSLTIGKLKSSTFTASFT